MAPTAAETPIPTRLRVLVSGEPGERFDEVTRTLAGLDYDVTERDPFLAGFARTTWTERPDLAVVIVSRVTPAASQQIDRIVCGVKCPVIVVSGMRDRRSVTESVKRGIFAFVADGHDPQEMQSVIDIALRRFAEYHDLEGAFGRRAITERAKGVLMERNNLDERQAFSLLRDRARRTNRKLVDVAESVLTSRPLLRARTNPRSRWAHIHKPRDAEG
jgi:response regulator NasT